MGGDKWVHSLILQRDSSEKRDWGKRGKVEVEEDTQAGNGDVTDGQTDGDATLSGGHLG